MAVSNTLNLGALHLSFCRADARKGAVMLKQMRGDSRPLLSQHLIESNHERFIQLLYYYSLLEIALQVGAINPTFEDPRFVDARENLRFRPLLSLSRTFYPMALPLRLHDRLSGGLEPVGKYTFDSNQLFHEFLLLTGVIRFDDDVGLFLNILDGGTIDGWDYPRIMEMLGSPEVMAGVLGTPTSTDTDARITRGLIRIFEFCVMFVRLLHKTEAFPVLDSEMRLYHSELIRGSLRKIRLDLIADVMEGTGANATEVRESLHTLWAYGEPKILAKQLVGDKQLALEKFLFREESAQTDNSPVVEWAAIWGKPQRPRADGSNNSPSVGQSRLYDN